jgi:polar amino acid transport system substrate-binding protein
MQSMLKLTDTLRIAVMGLLILLLNFCDHIPADPDKSFEDAKLNGLKIGFSANPPWVADSSGVPHGVEPQILKGFARENKINILWENGPEQEL